MSPTSPYLGTKQKLIELLFLLLDITLMSKAHVLRRLKKTAIIPLCFVSFSILNCLALIAQNPPCDTVPLDMEVVEGHESLILSNVLFNNDFENPFHTNFVNCSPDFAQNLVSSLYGDIFDQQWTVETMQINGPQNQ